MPFPTSSLPPSPASVSVSASASASPVPGPGPLPLPTAAPPHHANAHHVPAAREHKEDRDRLSDSLPPPPSSRSATHARRYTLSRFPLLRKGSRELTRTPSVSSISSSASKTHADSLFHLTGAPRSSHSIAREPPTSAPQDSHPVADESREHAKPDKMHQTSSRLLRMTDDERPYTKVSTTTCHHACEPLSRDET